MSRPPSRRLAATLLLALAVAAPPARAQDPGAACTDSLSTIYRRLSPAVVSIGAMSINPYDPDHRLDRVMGSGVIVDPAGLILTNSHVVFGRQVITVRLDDGTTVPAQFVGADPIFDVALLRIAAPREGTLVAAPVASSAGLQPGDEVYAIGNPLGLDQTLTRGIVSAVNRVLPRALWSLTEPLIQTDAAINPGNSGGPLVNRCGQVVGITTAILPDAQSIGFAVPTDLIQRVLPELVQHGHVVRPWVGVQGQFVAPGLKELLRVPLVDGFLVEAVEPGSPADRAGVQGGSFELTLQGQPVLLGGDIITEVNGTRIDSAERLRQALGDWTVGARLRLTLVRDQKARKVELTVTERPLLPGDFPRPHGSDETARHVRDAAASRAAAARYGAF